MHLLDLEFSEELKQNNSGSIGGGTDFDAKDTDLDFSIDVHIDLTSQFPENCFDNLVNFGDFTPLIVEVEGSFADKGYGYPDSDSHICEVSGSISSVALPFEIG